MKWKKKRIKTISILTFLLLEIGGSSVNTLSAQEELVEEIFIVSSCGRRLEGSVSRSHDINVKQRDIVEQVDDFLVLLRKGTLYSMALNSDADAPAEILSKAEIPIYFDGDSIEYENILVTDDFVIVLGVYEADDEEGVEINFYSFTGSGQLEFQERYFFTSSGEEDYYGFLRTMTVVDNNLVSIVSGYIDYDVEIDVIKQEKMLPMNVKRQLAEESGRQPFNVIKRNQWVNSFSSLIENETYAAVLNCPLDDVFDKGLQCNVTNLFGADAYSYYINQDAVYVSSQYYSGAYGVMAQSTEEYLQRTDHDVSVDFDDGYSAFYRVGLDYEDVTAVLYEGYLLNHSSYEVIDDSFVALLKKEETGVPDTSVYGLRFSLGQFSALPTLLPESDYQFLTSDDGRISANRFNEDLTVLAKSSGGYKEPAKNELIIWDSLDEEVFSVDSDFTISSLYFKGDDLLSIGFNEDDGLALEVWSTKSGIESVFLKHYDNYIPADNLHDESFLGKNASQSTWGVPVYRLDDDGETIEFNGDSIVDMQYFEIMPDSSIVELGQLMSNPQDIDDECQSSCGNWYSVERSFIVSDSVYAVIENEIIKGAFTSEGLEPLNRFNILNEEAIALGVKAKESEVEVAQLENAVALPSVHQ